MTSLSLRHGSPARTSRSCPAAGLLALLLAAGCHPQPSTVPAADAGTDRAAAELGAPPEGGAPDTAASWPICGALPQLCSTDAVTVPTFSTPVQVVPSPDLPWPVLPLQSNNNLDVLWHEGELYLAFRTASHHHPRDDAQIFVIRSPDLKHWTLERHVSTGNDLREPQLLAFGGQLHLYLAEVEAKLTNFKPIGERLTHRLGPGNWTPLQEVLAPTDIAWRGHAVGDAVQLIGYRGVSGIFSAGEIKVWWLQSKDGLNWSPVVPGQEFVILSGGSETDIAPLDDGGLVAVSRNELGDDTGFGSKICRAPAGAPGSWTCVADRKKYDSPLLFRHGQEVYLIARRNLTDSGDFDLGLDYLPHLGKLAAYQLDYWNRPKRCALWRVDPTILAVQHLIDLPSRGDTCFPEALRLNEHQYLVFNYTSPLDGDDLSWRQGQDGPTSIYYGVLTLP